MLMTKAPRRPARWVRCQIFAWNASHIEAATGVRPAVDDNDIRLISISEVEEIAGLCRSRIYSLIAAGAFPRQVHLQLPAVKAAA